MKRLLILPIFLVAGSTVLAMDYNNGLAEKRAFSIAMQASLTPNTQQRQIYNEEADFLAALQASQESYKEDALFQTAMQDSALEQQNQGAAVMAQQLHQELNSESKKRQNRATPQRENSTRRARKITARGRAARADYASLTQVMRNGQLTQLHVANQQGNTCGYHAVFNSWAVQQAVESGQIVNSQNVQNWAQKQHYKIRDTKNLLELAYPQDNDRINMGRDTIIRLSQDLNLKNTYILKYQTRDNIFESGGIIPNTEYNMTEVDQNKINYHTQYTGLSYEQQSDFGLIEQTQVDYNQFLQMIRHLDFPMPLVGHIICNYNNGHWTTFSVVKHPGQEPNVYYMNSSRVQLRDDSSGCAVAQHIVSLIWPEGHQDVAPGNGRLAQQPRQPVQTAEPAQISHPQPPMQPSQSPTQQQFTLPQVQSQRPAEWTDLQILQYAMGDLQKNNAVALCNDLTTNKQKWVTIFDNPFTTDAFIEALEKNDMQNAKAIVQRRISELIYSQRTQQTAAPQTHQNTHSWPTQPRQQPGYLPADQLYPQRRVTQNQSRQPKSRRAYKPGHKNAG